MVIPELKTRVELAVWCNANDLTRMVEIGVDAGKFTRQVLESTDKITIHGVDPWITYSEMSWDRTTAKDLAYRLQELYPERLTLHETTSMEYLKSVKPPHPQFIFIDGNHHTKYVYQDLVGWWGVLDSPGVLAGHDWDLDFSSDFSVKKAVKKFVRSYNYKIPLHIINETGNGKDGIHPSYYVLKGFHRAKTINQRSSQP